MNLRTHVRQIQLLENKAAEKAGARFQILEISNLIKTKGRNEYIDAYIDRLLLDIKPELEESAKKGVELNKALLGD